MWKHFGSFFKIMSFTFNFRPLICGWMRSLIFWPLKMMDMKAVIWSKSPEPCVWKSHPLPASLTLSSLYRWSHLANVIIDNVNHPYCSFLPILHSSCCIIYNRRSQFLFLFSWIQQISKPSGDNIDAWGPRRQFKWVCPAAKHFILN